MNDKDKRDYTPKEQLFGNLNLLKAEINELKNKLKEITNHVDAALSWEPLITDVDEGLIGE